MDDPGQVATPVNQGRSAQPASTTAVAPATDPAGSTFPASAPSRYYFISDLHIGGDGVLDHCDFENELIGFLRDLESAPGPAELIIIGDAFGLWELTEGKGPAKLEHIASTHQPLFEQFRRAGRHVTITLLPGNHDYDLACYPEYVSKLAEYNIRLDPSVHTERRVGQHKIWIEHGNQHDSANTFPDFGNPYGQPVGYFITADVVGVSGRHAGRSNNSWLGGLHSVYPTEEIPMWVLSNYFYREMGSILRWCLLPFLLLFTFSIVVLAGRALETAGILHTAVFHGEPFRHLGLPGRLIDFVLWANGTIFTFVLMLAVPLFFVLRDIRATLRRYGVERSEGLKQEKDHFYVDAARAVFAADPAVALFIYGHTHAVSVRELGGRYIINTGTWLKRLQRVRPWFGWLPPVFVPSFRLNYFVVSAADGQVRVQYHVVPKQTPKDLTLLQTIMTLWRKHPGRDAIPLEIVIGGDAI